MGLREYAGKRRFDRTPEPTGKSRRRDTQRLSFVVQKHAARNLHYDFRLEYNGVLKSWAVPKGPSDDPKVKRLAVEVEDHPLEYGSFEGTIPKGQYGAGTVEVWDHGTWQPEGDPRAALKRGSLHFKLAGRKLSGRWHLVRMKGDATDAKPQWLLQKSREALAVAAPAREPVSKARKSAGSPPRFLAPQLATLVSEVPSDDGWLHEIKFDGYRIQARLDHGKVTLRTRNGLDWTNRFKEVAEALALLDVETALLDGEVAVTGVDGVTHFHLLQQTIKHPGDHPLSYYVFDLLHLNGDDLTATPLENRKRQLASLFGRGKRNGTVRMSDHVEGQGDAFHLIGCRKGLEGIVSKRRDAPYTAGRSKDWLKGKCRPRQEFVIGGYTEPQGGRRGFGALLLGVHEESEGLTFVGRVGSGFDDAALRDLTRRLVRLKQKTSPFKPTPRVPLSHWVKPQLIAEVSFATWTTDRQLRQAAFEGLREDKAAKEIPFERESAIESRVAGVVISHPGRAVYSKPRLTKMDLAQYIERVSERMLPHVVGRPLMLLRCPSGAEGTCFFQKHPSAIVPKRGAHGRSAKSADPDAPLIVHDTADLVTLIQNGALEIHTNSALRRKPGHPDRLIFDLDPHESVAWAQVVEVAKSFRQALEAWELPSFVKTSGGKGVHILVPIEARHSWEQVRRAANRVAATLIERHGSLLTLRMAKASRVGKIFIDTLRNGRAASCVAPYSPRARAGATISMPISWSELSVRTTPDLFTVGGWLSSARHGADPWKRWETDRARLPSALVRAK